MINKEQKYIAWFIPAAYLFHLADEYFAGFYRWFSVIFNVNLSLNDFIIINSIGFTAAVAVATLYSLNKLNHFVIAVLSILFFVNGVVHIAASIFTASYSPGTISACLFYLPLGYLVYKKIFPLMPYQQRSISIAVGIIIQIVVAIIALNI
ncbi:MAG: HXXEE domain-containing protein [bacterium]|nr:HXXEE domain-containing protein [bacterium]